MATPEGPGPVRTLVLSVDIGAGHRMAAQALVEAIAALRPGSEARIVDALELVGPDGGRLAREIYFGSIEAMPDLWGRLYAQREVQGALRPASEAADDMRSLALGALARDLRPDLIVAMHPIAVGLGASVVRLEERVDCPLVAVVTDFDAHPLWMARGVDLYVVASRKVASGLVAQGLPSGDVAATGIPLRGPFAAIRDAGPAEARARLGLDPARLLILLLGGGLGLGPVAETARRLALLEGPLQLAVVAGANEELETEARRLATESRLPVVARGRVEAIWDYVAAADLAVGKPGGLTCAELLAAGVPLVALAPIPGQEQANCDALVAEGAAVEAMTPEAAEAAVRRLLEAPASLERMRLAASALGRPVAARDGARRVLALVDDWRAGPRPRRVGTPADAAARAGRALVADLDELARSSGLAPDGIVRPAHELARAMADEVDGIAKATGLTPKRVMGSLSELRSSALSGLDSLARTFGLADDDEEG